MKSKNAQHEIDMLHGRILDKLLLLALPLAATGILQQLFNAVDVAVVGSYVGESAMAAVGSNSPIVNLLVNLFTGISLGTNVIIAQSIGAGNHEGIHKAVHTSIIVAVLGGIAVCLIGQMIANPLISRLSVPEDVFPMAVLYLRIYLAGMPVILLYNFEAAVFRSMGDTRTPLFVLTCSGLLNAGLNIFLVVVVGMTVDGVAIATVVSNAVSAVILFILLCHRQGDIRVDIHSLRIDWSVLKRILRVGVPAGVQGMVFSLANICVQSAINSLDTVIMAASSAAYNLEVFTYCMINSFGQACTTIVGQNYGAGQPDRCKKTLKLTLSTCAVCFVVAAVLILSFSTRLLSLFNKNPAVIHYGLVRLQYIFLAHIFSLLVEVLSGYLRGFGMSIVPAACSLLFICGIRILWVYLVFPMHPTFSGIMVVYPISLSVTAGVIALACFLVRKKIANY